MSAESLEEQFDGRVTELALLDSMYPDQLECDDDVITNYIKSENFSVVFGKPITGSFVVDKSLTVCFVLSQSYPEISKAQIHCRVVDGSFEKSLQKTINDDVNKYIENDGTSLMDILQYIIQHWENIDKNVFLANKSTSKIKSTDDSNDLSRFWIYSHHIYSSTKRKSILELSQSLKLKGFILIGKPGFICVEGKYSDCDEFWTTVRSWNWQRISLIESERELKDCCFEHFREYTDRSAIFRIIEANNCDSILRNFLGFK